MTSSSLPVLFSGHFTTKNKDIALKFCMVLFVCISIRDAKISPKEKPEPRPAPPKIYWAQHRARPASFKLWTKPASQRIIHCDRLSRDRHELDNLSPGSAKSPAGPDLCISNLDYVHSGFLDCLKLLDFISIYFGKLEILNFGGQDWTKISKISDRHFVEYSILRCLAFFDCVLLQKWAFWHPSNIYRFLPKMMKHDVTKTPFSHKFLDRLF